MFNVNKLFAKTIFNKVRLLIEDLNSIPHVFDSYSTAFSDNFFNFDKKGFKYDAENEEEVYSLFLQMVSGMLPKDILLEEISFEEYTNYRNEKEAEEDKQNTYSCHVSYPHELYELYELYDL